MKKISYLIFFYIIAISCEDNFDINNPDVEEFVSQLKSGDYKSYAKNEDGEKLWLAMPNFNETHIQALINFSNDTSHIREFPFNPISSRMPYPSYREYAILGECLLWVVEGIRNGSAYGSLDPYLIDNTLPEQYIYKGINGQKVLNVRTIYQEWWDNNKNSDWQNTNPLEATNYSWF